MIGIYDLSFNNLVKFFSTQITDATFGNYMDAIIGISQDGEVKSATTQVVDHNEFISSAVQLLPIEYSRRNWLIQNCC
ncbi:hypothetical protein D3C81_1032550 [compost metagenome]